MIEFADESLTLPISQELKAVRQKGIIRLVDMLYIHRAMDGTLNTKEISDPAKTEKADYGAMLRGLLGPETAKRQEGNIAEITQSFQVPRTISVCRLTRYTGYRRISSPAGRPCLRSMNTSGPFHLKEAIINAGGEVIASGTVNPDSMALGGAMLEDALEAALRIGMDAEQQAAAVLAEAQMVESTTEKEAAEREASDLVTGAQVAGDEIAAGAKMAAEEDEE